MAGEELVEVTDRVIQGTNTLGHVGPAQMAENVFLALNRKHREGGNRGHESIITNDGVIYPP